MRRSWGRMGMLAGVVGLGLLGVAGGDDAAPKGEPRSGEPRSGGPVVVELFTSEGCSSCPPAEALLNELQREAREDGRELVFLAWHVDYWDRLGWPDRFASPEVSTYQRAYGRAMKARSIYTPQMVVQGAEGFVGSKASVARDALRRALAKPAPARLTATAKADEAALVVSVTLEGRDAEVILRAAITEDGLETEVARGENAGRTLRHDAVVRAFAFGRLSERMGELRLRPPEDLKKDKARLVVFAQDPESFEVLASATLALP